MFLKCLREESNSDLLGNSLIEEEKWQKGQASARTDQSGPRCGYDGVLLLEVPWNIQVAGSTGHEVTKRGTPSCDLTACDPRLAPALNA
jgi:hypothetical protein